MLELEKLGLVEMNSQEVQEVDGGFWTWLGGTIAGSLLYETFQDWDGNVAAFKKAYNQGRS